jgi:nicotinate-nucleotide pyrophosphorylase (carboxylating)
MFGPLSLFFSVKRRDESTLQHLFRRLQWEELDEEYLSQQIRLARAEDLAGAGLQLSGRPPRLGDATTEITPATGSATARLVARQDLIVCGLPLLPLILTEYGPGVQIEAEVRDGTAVPAGARLATLRGAAGTLLQAERVMLNFLQHLTGIASETGAHVDALDSARTRLLDTRKTTPGWRVLEKYAVATGGGWNHRLGLFDRIMLKDNHLAASGATAGERLADAVRRAKEARPDLLVEVEVDEVSQIEPVLRAEADVILFDNFSVEQLREAVALVGEAAYTEASGGVSLKTLPALGQLGLDFVSCGAITHQSRWKDIALDWS